MDDGLALIFIASNQNQSTGLNPYCSGRWSRTCRTETTCSSCMSSLNPCCSGRWSRTLAPFFILSSVNIVFILIVVEDGLVHSVCFTMVGGGQSLNPYCSGRWSRTHPSHSNECASDSLNPYCNGQWSHT